MIEFDSTELNKENSAKIKVVGVGGAGGNTVNSIIESGYQGIEYIAVNTDAQALENSKAATKIRLGARSTKGLGSGANPEVGRHAAQESINEILEYLDDSDIVFLTAGMGGGTGSGGLPVIAQALKERNILTIAVVTKPFAFEGKKRAEIAEVVIRDLKHDVDTLIVIPNQKLLNVVDSKTSMIDAFNMINSILGQSVKSISDIITKPGHINVDFADVKTIMKDRGLAIMGTARATGQERALEATMMAISSPLLENMDMQGSKSVLLNITGSKNLSLHEISQAASIIYEQADPDAQIILGSVIDENLADEVQVTIIATGFEQRNTSPKEVAPTIRQEMPMQNVALSEALCQKQSLAAAISEYKKEKLESKLSDSLEDDLDIPAFIRKNEAMEIEK